MIRQLEDRLRHSEQILKTLQQEHEVLMRQAKPGVVHETLPCHDCGQYHQEFSVDSVFWNRIMRPDGKETDREYLCLACFHRHVVAALDAAVQERDDAIAERKETQAEFHHLSTTLSAETWAAIDRAEKAEAQLGVVHETRQQEKNDEEKD